MQAIPDVNAPDAKADSSDHSVEASACSHGGGQPPHRLMRLPPRSRAEAILQRRLVLVAQNRAANHQTSPRGIGEQLTLLGYVVDVATNGNKALQLWRSGDYALLFTDLQLPQMDCYALTRAIRAETRGPHLPIVALTGDTLETEAAHCLAAGMDDCLHKAVSLERLAAMVEKWLPDQHILSPTEPEPLPEDTVTLDIRIMQKLVGDEPELTRELLMSFEARARVIAQKLTDAIRAEQYRDVADVAHSLKSSAHMVGAIPLSRLSQIAEHAAQNMDLQALQSLLPEFEAEMQAVLRELSSTLAA